MSKGDKLLLCHIGRIDKITINNKLLIFPKLPKGNLGVKQFIIMNFKSLFGTMLFATALTANVQAQQPYGACWHPLDITNWSPETDPDAKFNRSSVPFVERFKEPNLMKANANQHYEGQVCNSTILYHTCSLCPSQGANNFTGYQPTYWQYQDMIVYWAGSASEGIIIPPPAPSIDAAHMNGVRILGQIFFPPSNYGGKQEWVRQMLTKENGKYIYAIKLYEIARYLGFDGWFINEETGGGSNQEWVDFIKDFNAVADANGDTYMEIQWYNASRTPNKEILKTHKNTSQFLEYYAEGDYRYLASELGCTENEVMQKIYSGVQTVYGGLAGYGSSLRKVYGKDGHTGSLDLFCPEERIWKDNVKDILDTPDNCGELAYAAMKKTFENEELTWVNRAGDPTDLSAYDSWPGFSGCILERSNINSLPFTTSFNVGIGKYRFVKGEKRNTQDWYHSGTQSIMPTWRWWIENKGDLKAGINWDDAYNFGASAEIKGTLTSGDHLVRMYKTMIPVDNGGKFRLVYKTSTPGSVEVKLGIESSVDGPWVTLSNPSTTTVNGWTVAEYDMSSVKGKTVYVIALNLKSASTVNNYNLKLGELTMLPANYSPVAPEVTNLETLSVLGEENGDIRLTWDFEYNNDFDHFDIYTETVDGVRKLVGQTRGEAFYIPKFDRNGSDSYVTVSVVPILKDMSEAEATSIKVDYPKATAPVVSFVLSQSYAKVNDEVEITVNGTGNPTAFEWKLPESLQLVSGQLTDQTIKVKCLAVGPQMITVKATNSIGTSETETEVLEVLSEDDFGLVENVALNKTVHSYSGSTNDSETPANLIDGETNPSSTSEKWCNISSEHWAIFDLEGVYKIYGFKFYDCKAGPEDGQQVDTYRIYVSNDAKDWKLVVDAKGRANDNIKSDFVAPVMGRYVKFNPYSESGMTIRIWEFEVYGREDNNMIIDVPETLDLTGGKTQSFEVSYDLNGDERAAEFTCNVTPSNENVTVESVVENAEEGKFVVTLNVKDVIGLCDLKVVVDNGGRYKEKTVRATVDSQTAMNLVYGVTSELRHYTEDYSFEAEYTEYSTDKLTDGNVEEDALLDIENPSIYKDDFWAIFDLGSMTRLSKVKINIPGENYGLNDNDKEGYVNKDISIRVSSDKVDWKTIKSYNNLEKIGEISYILEEVEECRYIAVVCNLNAYFYPSLSEVEVYGVKFSESVYSPVTIASGFNADVVAEATPSKDNTTAVLDDQGWVLFSSGVQEEGALPAEITTVSGAKFKFADFASSNAAVLKGESDETTLVFDAPAKAKQISLLSISANGTSTLEVTVNYSDETSVVEEFEVKDWYSDYSGDGEAYYGLGRIITVAEGYNYDADDIDDRYKFRLFEQTVETDPTKTVVSVKVKKVSYSGYPTVLAVSKLVEGTVVGATLTMPETIEGGSLKVTYEGETEELQNGASLEYGRTIVVEAVPDKGYKAESVTINGKAYELTENKCSVVVTSNAFINATFKVATGISENNVEVAVYPTLVEDALTVKAEVGNNVVVLNVAGMQVYANTIEGDELLILTTDWESGIYFVTVAGKTVKVIKK